METLQGGLYDYPSYYDLVFGSDWKAEYDFLLKCFEHHAKRPVKRLFEPACGTGRLLYRLARTGCEVSGLDINPHAVDYCNARLKKHGFPETAFIGDMSDFRLKRKADAAFNTINSFRHLTTAAASEGHIQCMANALAKGGIYVLGLHLTPTSAEPSEDEAWSARRGNLCVNTRMWLLERNLRKRQEKFAMAYDIYTPKKQFQMLDEVVFRTYKLQQFYRLLETAPELEIAAVYDFAYEFEHPIDPGPATEDVVFILRKK